MLDATNAELSGLGAISTSTNFWRPDKDAEQ